MHRARLLAVGVWCLGTFAGACGTLLGIEPDDQAPGADGGMLPDASPDANGDALVASEAGGDAADAAPTLPVTCTPTLAPNVTCTLATGIANLGTIAVGNGYVYFAHHQASGTIHKVPTAGGGVTPFTSGGNMPAGLFASPSGLYWVTSDNIVARQLWSAASPDTSDNGGGSPAAQIVSVGPNTSWTIPATGTSGQVRVSSVAWNAGAPLVPMATSPTALAMDGTYVYYAAKAPTGHFSRVPITTGATTTAADPYKNVNAMALSMNAGIVAFTSEEGVFRTSTGSDTDFTGRIAKVSATATGVGLVADEVAGTLYVLTAGGTLESIANVPPPAASTKQVPGCSMGTAIAQDSTHVYVACNDSIIRVSKLP